MKSKKTPHESAVQVLQKICDSDKRKKVRLRAQIILAHLKGQTPAQIQKKFQCCYSTVRKWIKSWYQKGIGAVVTWRQTHSWHKAVRRRFAVEKLVLTPPHRLRLRFRNWSLRKLSTFFEELVGKKLSISTLSRDLRLLNIRYRQIKDTFTIKPPDYDLWRADLRLLEHLRPPRTRLIYVDEKGPVHVLRYKGRTWSLHPPVRDVRQRSQGKVTFLGGYDPHTRELVMVPMSSTTSEGFCDALEYLRLDFLKNPYNQLIFVMDNASIHHSRYTRQYLSNMAQIDYCYLPPYSPELNPIEICFKHYQQEVLDCSSFHTLQELLEQTEEYVIYYNDLRKEIYASPTH